MHKIIILICVFCLISISVGGKVNAADFNPNILISDDAFININDMSVDDIQDFLDGMGGILKDYSEFGRSAAQIIYDASHGYGHASGKCMCCKTIDINTSTGTVNPKVLLITMQKDQGLITRTDYSQYSLAWAMGYGCSDNLPPDEQYRGFTNQVEHAAWQFRFNYERAQGNNMTGYQVGDTIRFLNTYPNPYNGPREQDVHIDNRATASLYRYTPHAYNGNYIFWRLYNEWF
jgi:hypothetical protein